MLIQTYPDYKKLSRATADLIAGYIRKKPDSLICFASGHTPLGVFECLTEDIKLKKLDLTSCIFVSLDEWVGIGPEDDGSCRLMMDQTFFGPTDFPESRIYFFDGLSEDLQREVDRINNVIKSRGGLDIMLVGIGTNGHVAMNEPGTSFDSIAHVSELADETKSVGQKYFKKSTPLKYGITVGLKHFSDSKLPILMANGEKKTAIIQRVLKETPGEHLPASIVQKIPGAYVMLDHEAAGGLVG